MRLLSDARGNVWAAFVGLKIGIVLLSMLLVQCLFDKPEDNGSIDGTLTILDSGSHMGPKSIVLGAEGHPFISYLDVATGNLKVLKCETSDCSGFQKAILLDSNGETYASISSAIGADARPAICYSNTHNNDLKVLKCGNPGCSSGNTVFVVDSSGNSGIGSSIQIGTDGFPIVAYPRLSEITDAWELVVLKCGNAECSSGNNYSIADASDEINVSMALGMDGLPIIAYYEMSGQKLKVIKCGDDKCSSSNKISVVDTAGDPAATGTSIAIGKDGFPIIGYNELVSRGIEVIKCGDEDCSRNNVKSIIAPNNTQEPPSIAVGVDGLPTLVYVTENIGEVRIVKCGNRECSGSNSSRSIETNGLAPQVLMGSNGYSLVLFSNLGGKTKLESCQSVSCN